MPTKIKPVRSFRGTSAAMEAAKMLRNAIAADPEEFESLTPYYIAAVCAHMEGTLNNCFVEFLHRKLGKCYMPSLRPFLFMKIQDRMELAPMLLSDYRFKLNAQCEFVKSSLRLFDMRNHFIHVKDLWHYADVEYGNAGEVLGWEFNIKNHPDPYRADWGVNLSERISIEEVADIQDRFTRRFGPMPNAVNRKGFRPDDWLVRVKRT